MSASCTLPLTFVAIVTNSRLHLLHRVQRVGVLCASSPSSSSVQDEEPSWKPHESSPQTPTCAQSEECTDRGLRRGRSASMLINVATQGQSSSAGKRSLFCCGISRDL